MPVRMNLDSTPVMYHVKWDLEQAFGSLADCLVYRDSLLSGTLNPYVPHTCMPGEDNHTARVCACETLEGAISAIGCLGTFRRCCNADPDAKSYENDDEVYPVIVVSLQGGTWLRPSKLEVPDAEYTGEMWCLTPVHVADAQLMWLDAYSLTLYEHPIVGKMYCSLVRFVEHPELRSHPWIDGKGHPLVSSKIGTERFVCAKDAMRGLFYDRVYTKKMGYAVPEIPVTSYSKFYVEGGKSCVRVRTDYLFEYTGVNDTAGEPVFVDDTVSYKDKFYRVAGFRVQDNTHYLILGSGNSEPIELHSSWCSELLVSLENRKLAGEFCRMFSQ